MKTKLLLTALLSFPFYLLSSQVPQGFNYQAIARDGSGNIIANKSIPIKIDIQTSLTGGTVIYEETFSPITSNQFGLITLVVGTGTQTGGTTAFSAIDWKAQPLYLMTTVQYPGTTWTTMGTSQIWAVPYSLVAKDVQGPLTSLGINGTTTYTADSALFEVKNKDGNTVFAVYNEGVRVYVSNETKGLKSGFAVGGFGTDKGTSQPYLVVSEDSIRMYLDTNPLTKGSKSMFAVGGYDMTKGASQDYLDVSPDSVNIYINSNPSAKGAKSMFAVGGYDMTKGGTTNYLNVNTDTSGIINPSQNRILWYPVKNAFSTGRVLIEAPDSVGTNSFASGYESKAKGLYSQALGYQAIARGNYSTSIGYQSVAQDSNSFAFGQWAKASNSESYAFGRGAIAEGYRSFAFGSAGVDSLGKTTGVAYARGDYSFAIGQGSQSLGTGSFAFGLADTARGSYSLTLGYKASANGWYSTAMGGYTTSSGTGSTAIGYMTLSSGIESTAIGIQATASGQSSIAMGTGSIASATASTAIGYSARASGLWSIAMGYLATANNQYSTAIGRMAQASGIYSTAIGRQVVASGTSSTAMGSATNATGGYSTAMGYSTVASGDYTTAMGTATVASGDQSTAIGSWTTAPSYCETAIGSNNTTYTPLSTDEWNPSDRLFVIGNSDGSSSPSNAITVMKNGNVEIGTSTPACVLDVAGTIRSTAQTIPTSGSGLEMLYTGGNGFIVAINRGTSTRGSLTLNDAFSIANTGGLIKMALDINGNLGIGTTAPGQKLDIIAGNGRVQTGYSWLTNSDIRYKKNIYTLEGCLEKVMAMRGVSFDLISDSLNTGAGRKNIGFIAQELENIVPEVVVTGSDGYKAVAYDKLTAVLTEAIKEQQKQIESYKSENDNLKLQVQSLQGNSEQIESQQKEIDELKTLVNSLIANQTAQVN